MIGALNYRLSAYPLASGGGGGGKRGKEDIRTLCCVPGEGILLPQHLSESYSNLPAVH